MVQGTIDDKGSRPIERQSVGGNVLSVGSDVAAGSSPAAPSSSSSPPSLASFDPLAGTIITITSTPSTPQESPPPSQIELGSIIGDSPQALLLAGMAPAEGSREPSTSAPAFPEPPLASTDASPPSSSASTSSHRFPAPASPSQLTAPVADRTAIHLARPTASPASPLSTQHDQVQDVLALFRGAGAAATSPAGERWEPIATDPDAALDPNDYSTLELLEHLHPADLRALADSIKTWPGPAVASGSGPDASAQAASNGRSFFRQGESAYGPPPPLLRVQDAGGKLAKRNGKRTATDLKEQKRQATQGDGSGPSADGYPICTTVSNAILSCYPQSNTTLVQNVWSKFIWNNNYPTFIGSRYVDIYLYNAGSEQVAANWTNVENNRGMIGILPQDSWFPTETSWVDGQNTTIPYFFIITSAGSNITGAEQHQATFTVVQTAPPTSLIAASLSSASGASAASLSSVLASLSAAQSSRSASGAANGNSSLQGDSGGSSFPHWAIALIVVLGVLALAACVVLFYFMCVSARRKRQIRHWAATSPGSVGSRSPMIQPEKSALMGGATAGAATAASKTKDHDRDTMQSPASSRPGSPLSANDLAAAAAAGAGGAALTSIARDGGSSRAGHRNSGVSEEHDGPITSADASRMADAFRKALRKPEFSSGDPSPGSSSEAAAGAGAPGDGNNNGEGLTKSPLRDSMHAQLVNPDEEGGGFGIGQLDEEEPEAREIMDRELASEGRSMASVENRRRPEVHAP